jgi:hypothetical protein
MRLQRVLAQPGQECFTPQGRAEQVRVEHAAPLVRGQSAHLAGGADAGAVDEQAERRPPPPSNGQSSQVASPGGKAPF